MAIADQSGLKTSPTGVEVQEGSSVGRGNWLKRGLAGWRRERYILIVSPSDVEIEDIVMVHGMHTGVALSRFFAINFARLISTICSFIGARSRPNSLLYDHHR
jgi:hypothetical protein